MLLDEFARLGRASVVASGFSYVAVDGIRRLPVSQAGGQLRDVYGPDVTSEIVQNCGVELVFTPQHIGVAKEISERLGSYADAAQSKSRRVWEAFDGSVSVSAQLPPPHVPHAVLPHSQADVILLCTDFPPPRSKNLRPYNQQTDET